MGKKSDVTHESKKIEIIASEFQQNLPLPLFPSVDVFTVIASGFTHSAFMKLELVFYDENKLDY